MTLNEATNSVSYESVQFSRTQGFFSATALGGSVMLGVGIFVTGAEFLRLSGSDAPLVFCVSALLFLPLILSCVQRSSGGLSNPSFYGAARASGSTRRLFFTAWLTLGGYLALGALLAYGAATRANLGLERIFGFDIGIEFVTALVIASAFAKEILTKRESWKSRTVIFWCCAIFFLLLAIWGLARFRTNAGIPKTEPLQHWLITVSMLASTLWSIDIVLNYRGQFRRPNRTLFWSLMAIFLGGNLLGVLITLEVLQNPSLMMKNWMAVLTWNETRLELLFLLAGLLICGSGLFRVMTRITRILGAMMMDGSIPSLKALRADEEKRAYFYSAFFSLVLAAGAILLSVRYLLLISGFAVLLSLVFYLQPLLKKDVSRIATFSLPFHPLIPATAILISIFLMWILPIENLLVAGLWLLAGAVLYWTTARKKMLPRLQQEQVLTAEEVRPPKAEYRVLVSLSDEQINGSLIRIGSSLATAKNGQLLVLRILETSESLPAGHQHKQGESEWTQMRNELQKIPLPGQPAFPIVRMAPDPISGIKATASEFAVDFLLVQWPKKTVERLRKNQLQNLLQLSAKPLAILKGDVREKPGTVFVACGSSDHALLALQVGEAIATVHQSPLEALKIVTRLESDVVAKDEILKLLERAGITSTAEIILREEGNVQKGIVEHSQESDLLVMGASVDPLSGRPLPDGPSMDVALHRKKATLIVKSKEESSRFLLRRGLAQLTNRISALTPKERSELLGQLKVGLQARADFYLMVALAAAIAITGLIMNDGSIVLGAMLVSPLMGPIVGIACGIALGNLDLIRRSSASTFKGMGVVLGMGVAMTFLLPSVEPTDQILSRTHPGIFDLLAALAAGAAGAYSLGRKTVAGALPGVAMSLSLEPPLATAGYGLSTSQFWIAGGAFLLFLTNLAAIVLSGVGVYLLLGMRPPRKEGMYVVGKAIGSVILVTLVLAIPLGLGTYGAFRKGHLKFQVETLFRDEAMRERFELLDLKISEHEDGFLIHPTVLASEEITPEKIERFRKAVESKVRSPIQIDAIILQTRRIESPP